MIMKEIHKKDRLINKVLPAQKLRGSAEYVLSSFILPFDNQERHFLFSTLTKECLEVPFPFDRSVRYSSDSIASDDLLFRLMQGYFLVPDGMDENAFYVSVSTMMQAFFRKNGYTTYTILPTFGCNARCVYCYEEGSKPVSMTEETAICTADFIARTKKPDSPILISWFGGEPLLGESTIDIIIGELIKKNVEFYSTMVTNGSLINDRIIKKMIDEWRLHSIQITFDGSEEDYIKRKRYYKYDDYYHRIINNIALLQSKGVSVNIRCNIDMENIDSAEALIEDLKKNIADRTGINLYFAPLNQVRSSSNALKIWERISELEPLIKDAGFVPRKHRNPIKQFRIFRCMADNPSSSVVIQPDGSLVPCLQSDLDSSFGNVREGVTDMEIYNKYNAVGPVREQCRNCAFLPDCTPFPYCKVIDAQCYEQRMQTMTEYFKELVEEYDRLGAPIEEGINPEELSIEEKAKEINE